MLTRPKVVFVAVECGVYHTSVGSGLWRRLQELGVSDSESTFVQDSHMISLTSQQLQHSSVSYEQLQLC